MYPLVLIESVGIRTDMRHAWKLGVVEFAK
jgi:hypothetical protein